MFILDTNVVSELRKAPAGRANAQVVAWANSIAADHMYLSVISAFELERGLRLLERREPEQARGLRAWFENFLIPAFESRIIPIDTAIARRCACLHVPTTKPEGDSYIAATALVHGMTVVTRNEKDFTGTGVKLLNPWHVTASV